MLPMIAVRKQFGELAAADDTTFAPAASANKIALIKTAFSLEESLVAADLDRADFDGSTALAGVVGAQQCGIDPVTGDQVVTIKPPAGGYRWETTGDTNLPQTIFGYALYSNDLATLIAAEVFATPKALTDVGQEITLPAVKMTIVAQPAS